MPVFYALDKATIGLNEKPHSQRHSLNDSLTGLLGHPAQDPVESRSRWSWNLASLLWPWKRKARMKISTMVIPLLVLAAPAFAQEMPLPYAQGNVNRFLEANKANKRPSVVLYNFNLESG